MRILKNIDMKKTIVLALCTLSLASCKKYTDINQNPNAPTDVPAKVLLPTTTIGLGFTNANELGRVSSILMQYNAGIANSSLTYDSYNYEGSFNNQWDGEIYAGIVSNLRIIIKNNEATNPAYSGIAKIQLAYVISMATDLWGDVPYSQAGFGLQFPQPRYDKQEDIYQGNSALGITGLFDLVKSGIADLNKTSILVPGTVDDLVYGGDLSKWKRAANSLLLKFAITVSNVSKPLATSTVTAVLGSADGVIDDGKFDLAVPFTTSLNNQNPMYVYDISGSFKNNEMLSSRLLALSRSVNDTVRLAKFYTKPGGKFTAYENGANSAAPTLATRSIYNTYVVGANGEAPVRLLTAFQTKFNLAEAALTLGTAGDANVLYQAGITASMAKAGLTAAEISTYFTNNPTVVNLTGTTQDKLKQIITQKYLSWVGNGFEAYNDYRRTGFPVLALALNVTGGDNPSVIPKRLPYTTTEGNGNPNQPKPRPKTDQKVWWGL
jgi:hypothetical protein